MEYADFVEFAIIFLLKTIDDRLTLKYAGCRAKKTEDMLKIIRIYIFQLIQK